MADQTVPSRGSTSNPSLVVRMHGYGFLPQNPLRINVRRHHHGDS